MDGLQLSLREVLGAVSFVDCGDLRISRAVCDSRQVRPGDLFVALRGSHHDGHRHIEDAIVAGASGILVEQPQSRYHNSSNRIPQCIVRNSRIAWAQLCMAFRQHPAKKLTLAGVTGTNGKSTSTWILRSILQEAGTQCGLLGTIEYHDGRESSAANLTTPCPAELATSFSAMVRAGSAGCVMEISSHALDQYRCHAVSLAAGAITNVTQDHFDYHGSATAYQKAKSKISELLEHGRPLLIGIDDFGCRQVRDLLPSSQSTLSFGTSEEARLRVIPMGIYDGRMHAEMRLLNATLPFSTSLPGHHNLLNCLTAAGLAEQLGVHPEAIVRGIESVHSVPGRMELIDVGQSFRVFVDYAHTPDGLRHCIDTARRLTTGRVILIFGAGGDRDKSKRPLMAKAAQLADIVIVTSDNPRSEAPRQIIDDLLSGFDDPESAYVSTDRFAAIRNGIAMAQTNDIVIIAGRGHERVQQIGNRQICFDDRKVARRILQDLKVTKPGMFPHSDSRPISIPVPA